MRVRAKNRPTDSDSITLDDDPIVVAFATSVAALSDVWSAMVWLQTTSPGLNAIRRDIAQWARDTDAAVGEMYGVSVMSDEIRVILDGMPALVPRRVQNDEREVLVDAVARAQRLTEEGRAAITRVVG
jgi:hypothetical protein